jgi:hypothetical protein
MSLSRRIERLEVIAGKVLLNWRQILDLIDKPLSAGQETLLQKSMDALSPSDHNSLLDAVAAMTGVDVRALTDAQLEAIVEGRAW